MLSPFLQMAEHRENSAYPTPFPEPKDLQKNETKAKGGQSRPFSEGGGF